jgi:exosome complex RNA-binding protein Rrp4
VTQEVSPVAVVEDVLQAKVNMDYIFHKQLQFTTNMMKQIADKRRMEREFQVGDLVYLEPQPYR